MGRGGRRACRHVARHRAPDRHGTAGPARRGRARRRRRRAAAGRPRRHRADARRDDLPRRDTPGLGARAGRELRHPDEERPAPRLRRVARRPATSPGRRAGQRVAAATRDPRFPPMTPDELPAVAIEVSVLSTPRPLPVSSLSEAYAALRPGVDGVILETGTRHRATFLPQVWQGLPDPVQFLQHLWLKAGVAPGVWHEGTTLQTYTVRAWHEVPETPGEG